MTISPSELLQPARVPDVASDGPLPAVARRRPLESMADVPRELGRFFAPGDGPTLICLAGLHGNEPSGVVAIDRVLATLEHDPSGLRGRFLGLAGNRRALALRRRFLERDLNRVWWPERLAEQRTSPGGLEHEEQEQRELAGALEEVLAGAPGRVYLLDLHTTSGPGPAFAILDDTLPNREVALDLPVPLVLGLEEELSGTLASYLTGRGVTVVGFEAGCHDDPLSVARAEAAIWITMDSCGLLEPGSRGEPAAARERMRAETAGLARIVEVTYRHPISPPDRFEMAPGFRSFQPVRRGQTLAVSAAGPVKAPRTGLLLMPKYQPQGDDGYFLAREVRPLWLTVSALVRRLRLERMLHWLPGVTRHPELADTFVVDRRYARWLAPQLFHLLGFRRIGSGERLLVMRRRPDLPEGGGTGGE